MTDIKDDSYLFDGGEQNLSYGQALDKAEELVSKPFTFKGSDFHHIVMRGEKPFWDYVAERANEMLEKNR